MLSIFINDDIDSILHIQRPRGRHDDEIIWDLDKQGFFTVKSAYVLELKLANSNSASSSVGCASKFL